MTTLQNGRYRLHEVIGRGGAGKVWRAFDHKLGREVAIKTVLDVDDTNWLARSQDEAKILARLSHQNIVNIHDAFIENEHPYIVMQYVRGNTLTQLIDRDNALEDTFCLEIALAVAMALRAAHQVGIVHRDIKPSNVIVTEDRHIYVLDFGIALSPNLSRHTTTDTLVGTVDYMAPEVLNDGNSTAASDMWSLGVLLYTCVIGKNLFSRGGVGPTGMAVINAPIPPLMGTPPFPELVASLLNRDPDRRPSAAQVLATLKQTRTTRFQVKPHLAEMPETQRLAPDPTKLEFMVHPANTPWHSYAKDREHAPEVKQQAPAMSSGQVADLVALSKAAKIAAAVRAGKPPVIERGAPAPIRKDSTVAAKPRGAKSKTTGKAAVSQTKSKGSSAPSKLADVVAFSFLAIIGLATVTGGIWLAHLLLSSTHQYGDGRNSIGPLPAIISAVLGASIAMSEWLKADYSLLGTATLFFTAPAISYAAQVELCARYLPSNHPLLYWIPGVVLFGLGSIALIVGIPIVLSATLFKKGGKPRQRWTSKTWKHLGLSVSGAALIIFVLSVSP